jgi:hypothetical protein
MGQSVKEHLRLALRMMLKPLVKLLISQGVSHGDFSEAAKDVYVEVAIRHFDKATKVNQSRVAILTGLTRKEVKNVIDRAMRSEPHGKNFSRPSRVLAGWHSDPLFLGPYGMPLEIPYESPVDGGTPSFVDLVRTYSGDMAPRPMLKELMRIGAVAESENGTFKVLRRDFIPEALSAELVERLGEVTHNFFSTAARNIEKKGPDGGLFERIVFAENGVTDQAVGLFDAFVKHRGQEFLEELDNWLVAREKEEKGVARTIQTGFGMYHYIEEPDDKGTLVELLKERGLDSQEDSE